MSNSTSDTRLIVNLNNEPSVVSDILLPLIIPILITSTLGSIAWIVQKYCESRDERKKIRLVEYGQKLDIIWRLQLFLQRHKIMMQKYAAIRAGRFSVDSSPDDHSHDQNHSHDDHVIVNIRAHEDLDVEAGSGAPPSIIYATDRNLITQVTTPAAGPVAPNSQESELNETDQINMRIISEALSHYANHIKVGKVYDSCIIDNLVKIRELITCHIETLAPDESFSKLLLQLDKYTNLYESLRKVGDSSMPDRSQGAEFPEGIYDVVKNRLQTLTNRYNDLL